MPKESVSMMTQSDEHRATVVCSDAMNTILEARGSRKELMAEVFERVTRATTDPDALWRVTMEVRSQFPRDPTEDMEAYWPRINPLIIIKMGVRGSPRELKRMGAQFHEFVIGDTSLYTVREDTRVFLEWAHQYVTLAITSNQRHEVLIKLLKSHDILRYFGDRVYTSGLLDLSKPSPEFFLEVSRRLGVEIRDLVLYGNSLENDAAVSRLFGLRSLIVDRSGSLARPSASVLLPPGVKVVKGPRSGPAWVKEVCGLSVDDPEAEFRSIMNRLRREKRAASQVEPTGRRKPMNGKAVASKEAKRKTRGASRADRRESLVESRRAKA
jgi:FMN phosphatase YigB (HAD superfamily)